MPEFLLRYRVPEDLETIPAVRDFRRRAKSIAVEVQKKAEEVLGLSVIWEVREFGECHGMPDFYVTGWMTDNEETKKIRVVRAQRAIQALLESLAFEGETVACWFMGVKGKWGEGPGQMKNPIGGT